MREDIKQLLNLQELDKIRDSINDRLEEIPKLIEAEEMKSIEIENELNAKKNEIIEFNLAIKNNELELQSAEDFIRKQSGQLNTLKSNEAYTKMQSEISSKKTDIDNVESRILEKFEAIDSKNKEIDDMKKKLDAKISQIKDFQNEFKKEIAALNKNKIEVDNKIEPLIKKIDQELIDIYNKVKGRRGGTVLVEVEDSSCGGCHCKLPPQVVNEVLKEEKVVRCETCSRFLYFNENE